MTQPRLALWCEGPPHECPAARRLQLPSDRLPIPSECRNTIMGVVIAEAHQVDAQLLEGALQLAGLIRLSSAGRESVGEGIKLTGPLRNF